VCLATLRPLNFSKEKKEKKKAVRLSGRFQKKKFFKKNTTRYIIGSMSVKAEVSVDTNRYGWRFFLKPVGLELFFLNTWNLPLLPFFLFFVLNFQSERSCLIGLNVKE
jgi:hypothetical protein